MAGPSVERTNSEMPVDTATLGCRVAMIVRTVLPPAGRVVACSTTDRFTPGGRVPNTVVSCSWVREELDWPVRSARGALWLLPWGITRVATPDELAASHGESMVSASAGTTVKASWAEVGPAGPRRAAAGGR